MALVTLPLAASAPPATTTHHHHSTHTLATSLWLHGGSWHTVGPRTPPAELAAVLSPLVPLLTPSPAALIASLADTAWVTPPVMLVRVQAPSQLACWADAAARVASARAAGAETPTALLLTGGGTEGDAMGWAGALLQVAAGGPRVVAAARAPVAGRTTPPLWLGLANATLATAASRSGATELRAAVYAAVGRPIEAVFPLNHHSAVILLLPHPSSSSAPVSNAIVNE